MRVRSWLVMASAVAVTAAVFLGRPEPSQGAGGGVGTGLHHFDFSFGSTAAAFIQSQEEGVSAELVSLGRTNSGIGDAFCRLAVTFTDAQGVVLYSEGVDLGPGEIARVDLPRTATLDEALFYVTFQVLDTDRRGSVLPCSAIPSVRVYDRAHRRTAYYLPIANNGSVAN